MKLTNAQRDAQQEFRSFVEQAVRPHADSFDREERLSPEIIGLLAERGYLGAIAPVESGGRGLGMVEFGLLCEELGRGCASVRNLQTVQSMVIRAVSRWGSRPQKSRWLAALAAGKAVAAFALTEPDVGSDAASIQTTATLVDGGYLISGRKKWISFGQIADLFLAFAKVEGNISAFLVERGVPGLTIQPISGMLGFRASMLAALEFDECRVPRENLIGAVGFGLNAVAASALDLGRYGTAWGCVGLAQACLESSLEYATTRRQFGSLLKDHQLIGRMLADMSTNVEAARLLCLQAGWLKETAEPDMVIAACMAKYFASKVCAAAAADAVQIQGAHGCSLESPVSRHFRDSRVMEIIEGSSQMQQLILAGHAFGPKP